MKRGPPPAKGFDRAIPIALMRGRVMFFQQLPEYVCDFTILGNGILGLVRVMMMTRVHAPLAEIAWKYADAIAGLCTIAFGGPVSRELWLYSRYGTLRFFRVAESGLVEIDGYGLPFVNGKPVSAQPAIPGMIQIPSGPTAPTPGCPVPAVPPVGGPPGSGSFDPKSPIVRWLKKKYAGRTPGPDGTAPIGPIDLSIITDCAGKKTTAAGAESPGIDPGPAATGPLPEAPAGSPVGDAPAGGPEHPSVQERPGEA